MPNERITSAPERIVVIQRDLKVLIDDIQGKFDVDLNVDVSLSGIWFHDVPKLARACADIQQVLKAYFKTAQPSGLAVQDINGDALLDLVVANASDPGAVNVLLGKGDGTFEAARTYATDLQSVAVTAADLNKDGKLDLIVGNSQAGNISILLNLSQ